MMRNVCDYNLAKWDHYFSEKFVIIILFLSNSASRRTDHQKILVAYKKHMLHGKLCDDRAFHVSCKTHSLWGHGQAFAEFYHKSILFQITAA